MNKSVQIGLCTLTFLCGFSVFFILTGRVSSIWHSYTWPSTIGHVVSSGVSSRYEDFRVDKMMWTKVQLWDFQVSYKYSVADKDYSGSSWLKGVDKNSEEKWIARYPVGSERTIRYNPYSPEQSMLVIQVFMFSDMMGLVLLSILVGICYKLTDK